MRSAADILREIAFKKDSSKSVQNAFLKHLFKNANATSAQKLSTNSELPAVGEQLSFAEDILGTSVASASRRVRAG